MKLKKTMKKGISLVMTLALMFTLLLNVGVLEPKAAGFTMKIAGITVNATDESGVVYYKNGDAGSFTGTADSYNAKLEWGASGVTLTLDGLNMGYGGSNHIDCDNAIDMTMVLVGENKMYQGQTYMGMTAAFNCIDMPSANLTITGKGSLNLVCDNQTFVSYNDEGGVIGVNSLYITDEAKVNINVPKITSGSDNYGVRSVLGVNLDSKASLDINLGSTQSSGLEYIGIKSNTTSSQVKIAGESKLSITMGASTRGKIGIECYDFDATTSGNVSIDLGPNNGGTYGIKTNDFDVTDSSINITVGGTGAHTSYGVLCEQSISLAGNASLKATMKGGNWPNGIKSNGDLTMTGAASLDVNIESINNYAIGVELYDIAMSGNTVINVETDDPGQSSYGIFKTDSDITMSDNAKIIVALGDGTVESKGIVVKSLTMSGNSSVDVTSGNGPDGSYGISTTELSQISSNAVVTSTAGESTTESVAIRNMVAWEINGGQLEAISPAKAFNVAPTLATDKIFEVKAGADASSATVQTTTQKEEATTYTDNSYVLIRGLQPVDEVEVTDIDDIKHGDTPDTTASTSTTGVESDIPLTWAPTGSAVGGTEYTATMVITPADGYAFTADTKVYVDGTAVTATLQDDGTLKATTKKVAEKLNLVSVEGPSGEVVVDNGTALADMRLPGTVGITTDDGNMDQVDVRWNLSNVNYNPSSKEEQEITINGTAVIPDYVDAGNVSTTVSLTVKVKAATTEATTQAPTTEATTAATTQAPSTGSMTDTEAPTTATTAATTEAPDNSDANVKTDDNAPLNVMVVLMLLAGIGMVMVSKKRKETF